MRTEFAKIDSDRSTNPTQLLLVFGQNQVFWSETKFPATEIHIFWFHTYYSLAVKSNTSISKHLNMNIQLSILTSMWQLNRRAEEIKGSLMKAVEDKLRPRRRRGGEGEAAQLSDFQLSILNCG